MTSVATNGVASHRWSISQLRVLCSHVRHSSVFPAMLSFAYRNAIFQMIGAQLAIFLLHAVEKLAFEVPLGK